MAPTAVVVFYQQLAAMQHSVAGYARYGWYLLIGCSTVDLMH
jgi:hypothetical protein